MEKDLTTIAASVAHYMSGSWRLDCRPIEEDQRYMGVCILGKGQLSIRLQDGTRLRKEGMIHISGEIPTFGLSHREIYSASLFRKTISINVSWNREPQSIAADIMRRLMPDYLKAVSETECTVARYKKDIDTLKNVEHAFKCVVPDLRGYSNHAYDTYRRYYFSMGRDTYRTGELELSLYSGLHCDLKLFDLSIETAIRIMALLQNDKDSEH